MRGRSAIVAAASVALALTLAPTGCRSGTRPVIVSREALGTVVTMTAWGTNDALVRRGMDAAFEEMADVEGELDPYDPASAIAEFNQTPFEGGPLPPSALEILDRVDELGVQRYFSPTLFEVTKLYDFGGEGSVPSTIALIVRTAEAEGFRRDGDRGVFVAPYLPRLPGPRPESPAAGLDFGGAAKGLALDRAMTRLRRTPGIRAAMISTVSSTVVWGEKPDGAKWRVGIEDPRATGSVLAVVSAGSAGPVNISTSGDYQQFFERDGVRYHHILDPRTGRPARGVRSLTVFGDLSGLDADILSTALFVAGPEDALAYARDHGIGLYLVTATGKARSYVPPRLKGISLGIEREPKP